MTDDVPYMLRAGKWDEIPIQAGVYKMLSVDRTIIYIGKAKNLRRRLFQYRNAKRTRKHARMRSILKDACFIEWIICNSDLEATLLETELIQKHRPKWNIAGAFYFLYPIIGMRKREGRFVDFCLTTKPEYFEDFQFFGAFRSRFITGLGFFALMRIAAYFSHQEKPQKSSVKKPYSYTFTFRQFPCELYDLLTNLLSGKSSDFLIEVSLQLLESRKARRWAHEIEEDLRKIRLFYVHEALKLRKGCEGLVDFKGFIPQKERDLIFIRKRHVC